MNEIVFKIKWTGSNYRYVKHQRDERAVLDCMADDYYIMTNIDSERVAEAGIDALLTCINQVDAGMSLRISMNDRTGCFDMSLSLTTGTELPELLIFDSEKLLSVRRMDGNQIERIYQNAEKRGKEEIRKQESRYYE